MRTLTPRDAHALMNLLVKEATGQDPTIQIVDTSTFVSAGEQVLATGVENTLNALSILVGRTLMAVRPYKAKFSLTDAKSDLYSTRLRKISFYSKESLASGDWNTNLFTNFSDGYTNGKNANPEGKAQSTASMWEQHPSIPLEMNFSGQSVWQDCLTVYEHQLKVAFRSEADFNSFVSAMMVQKGNEIESQKEAFDRMAVLNFIGGLYDLNKGKTVVNLTAEYNAEFGTNYTSAELRTTYLKEFLAFFVEKFKLASDYLTNRSNMYHWSPAKNVGGVDYTILRHTPKDRQKAYLYNPLFVKAEAQVLPQIFHDNYLKVDNAEMVGYWQNINEPSKVNVTPAIPNTTDPNAGQVAGNNVSLDYVVGIIFDTDALMTMFQLEEVDTTVKEARKHYRNIWYSFSKNAVNDFTENAVLFIMKDN